MAAWWEGTLAAFDLETTGVDVEMDRIVTACVMRVDGSGQTRPSVAKWLVNPGIDIPKGASEIHGITTEQAQADGQDPKTAVAEITAMLMRALRAGVPVAGFNVGQYDLTLLDRECRRYGLPTLDELLGEVAPVLDGFVLDKIVEPRRRGKGRRKLTACAEIYGVRLDDAHEASADAWAAAGVVCRIAAKYSQVGRRSLAEVHAMQVEAKRAQDADYAGWLRSQARATRDVDEQIELNARAERCSGAWPIIPFASERQESAL